MRPLAGALFLVLLLPLAAAMEGDDFEITLFPGSPPVFASGNATATLVREIPGEVVEWNVSTTKPTLVGTIEAGTYFEVSRAKQARPEVANLALAQERANSTQVFDPWFFFTEVSPERVSDAGGRAHLANLTLAPERLTLRLGFPVTTGNVTLRLVRDATPPTFIVREPERVAHNSFYVETETNEYAYADLVIRKASGGEGVRNPTSAIALMQRFPIQGLDPETAYVFDVTFTDWSGNLARSPEFRVTTTVAPIAPKPEIVRVFPLPNTTIVETRPMIVVDYVAGDYPVTTASLFLDKRPVDPTRVAIEVMEGAGGVGAATYALSEALSPGRHTVLVELSNAEGGMASRQWTFDIAGSPTPAPALLVALAAVGGIAALCRRR